MSADNGGEQPPHVCVIGAGVCGLVAVKICLENGLRVTCYDKSSKYGGLWNYRPDNSNNSDQDPQAPFEPSVMRTTILNTSKELSSFSDFPPPATLPNFMRHSYYMDYIHSYVEKFHLSDRLNLEHEILRCQPVWDEVRGQVKWHVRVRNLQTQEEMTKSYDRLMVAVGHHNIPYAPPSYEGQHLFKGEIIHSARLKDILSNQRLADKRVLVVGFGNSACDAANDIAIVAKKCYVSCHRGQWFISRYLHGGPYDFQIKNRMYYYASKLLPTWLMDRTLTGRVEQRVNHQLLGLRPKHKPSEQVPAINDLFPYRIYTGGIVLKSSIRTFTETGVKFEGEEEEDEEHPIDVVVLATGYEAKISFLDELQLGIRSMEHNNEYDLFMNIFAPNLTLPPTVIHRKPSDNLSELNNNNNHYSVLDNKTTPQQQQQQVVQEKGGLLSENKRGAATPQEVINSLAFIGLVQPNGSITVVSELQARYASLVFKGKLELPKQKTMLKHMEQVRRMRSKAIRSHSRDQLIGNYVGYLEQMARLIGVRPCLSRLFFKDLTLWKALMFGPCVPYQYRLSGPGCWPEARETILTTKQRVYQGINEGKNHILYGTRRKCLTEKVAASKDKGRDKGKDKGRDKKQQTTKTKSK